MSQLIFFHPVINITMKERKLIDWVKLIVQESLPVGIVKKRSYRTFKDTDVNFSQERLKGFLFNMTKLVEDRFCNQMKATGCGTILHDGCSKNGVYYLIIYTYFIREVKYNSHKIVTNTHSPQLVLSACSLMAFIAVEDEESSDNE